MPATIVTPRTFVEGEMETAPIFNEQIRDNELGFKVPLTDAGKIAALSSATLVDLSGVNLTGIAKTGAANTFTAGTQNFNGGSGTRLVVPVGTDRWA